LSNSGWPRRISKAGLRGTSVPRLVKHESGTEVRHALKPGLLPFAAFLLCAGAVPAAPAGYANPATCATCHRAIAETYQRTGMGRSFYRPARDNTIEDYTRNNTYYHQASNQYFRMYQHDDRYFARRHQIGPDGQETNVVEKEIHSLLSGT
jgi:hypothetical protein